MLLRPDQLTITGAAILALSLVYVVKFSKRRYRDWSRLHRPGSYKQELGRYYGRYALSVSGAVFGLLLLLTGAHLATWDTMTGAMKVAVVEASRADGKIQLSITRDGTDAPPRVVALDGQHWVIRSEVVAFHEKLGLLGLGRYCRLRFADGLSSPVERVQGGYKSRVELAGSSPLFKVLHLVSPYMGTIIRTREEVSPAKPPAGKEEIWVIEGGSAG